jgi:hypothetical protein
MGLFDWFRSAPSIDARLREHIDRAANSADPRIRQLPGYEKRLVAGVGAAFEYCERIALAVPGPFFINRAKFASDPLVHALFGSADDIAAMLAASQPLRDYLAAHPAVPDQPIFALLGMRCSLNAGFGTRLAGDIIKRDEPQTTLNFSDHTLMEPTADLDSLHQRLAVTFYEGLLKGLTEQIETQRQELFELREHLALDKAMRRSAGGPEQAERFGQMQARIAELGDGLMPAALIPRLNETLTSPEACLRLAPAHFRIDRLGVVVEAGDHEAQADMIRFAELVTRDPRRWVVMCVRFEHGEAQAALAELSERRRYMVI